MFSLKLSMVGIFSPLGPKFKRERLWFLSTKLARILEVGVSRGDLGKDSPMMWKNAHTEKSRLILSKQGNPSSGNEKKKKVECSSSMESSAEEKPASSDGSGPTQLYLVSEKGDSFKQKGGIGAWEDSWWGELPCTDTVSAKVSYTAPGDSSPQTPGDSSSAIASGPTSNTEYVNLGKPRRQHSNKNHLFGIE